jgi:WhiB family redox-sensing transcriptional regulator
MTSTDWRHQAACRSENPDAFFPVGNTGPALRQIDAAKAICNNRCPVVDDCLRFALDTGQEFGVYGGTSEDERRALKRRIQRAYQTQARVGRKKAAA